ncbi:MAG: colicin V production CvpA [Cellvibrio sp. 79]|nr:MAG: colicin V production CvpA [Cellvibrio sp. 79]
MHFSTIVFFVLLAFFTWRGYQKGFIGSITRILALIVAYPAAIFFTRPFAKWLIANTSLDGLLVYFIAGTTIFLVLSLLITLLLNLLAKLIPDNQATALGSRIGGAGVGVFMGAIIGLIVVYGLGLIITPTPAPPIIAAPNVSANHQQNQSSTNTNTAPGIPRINDLEKSRDSFIEASAKKLIGNAAAAAVDLALDDKTTTQVTKAFVQDPQSMLTHVQQVTSNGQLQELMADEGIQSIMATGDTQALMRDPAFKELMSNPSVQALMTQSDVDGATGSKAAAEKMITAWNRVQTLKHDPRVIAIISDPEFQQQLNSPNKLHLMMNPKLNQLTEIIFSSDTMPANGMSKYRVQDLNQTNQVATPTEVAEEEEKAPTKIYRWTDENGHVHYSDKPVKN